MSTDDYSRDLSQAVMVRLMDLISQFERAGHERKHVVAAVRFAMEPVPMSDEQLRSFVENHIAATVPAAQEHGEFSEVESERMTYYLLDSAAKDGVMPSRVMRILADLQ